MVPMPVSVYNTNTTLVPPAQRLPPYIPDPGDPYSRRTSQDPSIGHIHHHSPPPDPNSHRTQHHNPLQLSTPPLTPSPMHQNGLTAFSGFPLQPASLLKTSPIGRHLPSLGNSASSIHFYRLHRPCRLHTGPLQFTSRHQHLAFSHAMPHPQQAYWLPLPGLANNNKVLIVMFYNN
jgi:hypothetical protein